MPKLSETVLTAKSVAAARALNGQRREIWDGRTGLGLRISPSGEKTWVVRYRTIDGRQPRMTLGPVGDGPGALDLRKARERAIAVRGEARDGGDPAGDRRRKATEAKTETIKTVADLADAYFEQTEDGRYRATRRRKKPETIVVERRLWRGRLKPELGAIALDKLRRQDVRGLIQRIADEAPIQSNRALALIRGMLNFAVSIERIPINPIAGLKAVGEERPRERVLNDDELKRLWAGLSLPIDLVRPTDAGPVEVHVSDAVGIAIKLSLILLQRRTEIAGMRKDELRLDQAVWVIGQSRMKAGKTHLVPLPDLAVSLIREALALQGDNDASDFVFPAPWRKLAERPIEGGAMSHALSDIYAAIGISGATLHDLRRTGAANMASERLKVQPIVISRVLGHTLDGGGGSIITARHYAIYDYAAEKRAALQGWERLLLNIVC